MSRSSAARLLTFATFLFLAGSAWATNFSSTQSGPWSSASTWGGAGVPGGTDNATINSGHTVTLTGNSIITDLSIGGGTLDQSTFTFDVNGTLAITSGTVTGSNVFNINGLAFNWSGGTLSGSGGVTINSTTVVAIGTFVVLDARPVTSYGTINLPASATLRGSNGTTLLNNGTIDSTGDASFDVCCTGTAAITNAGTIRKSGGTGNTTLGWKLTNQLAGSVQSNSGTGTLIVNDIGTSSGNWSASNGGTLKFAGVGGTLDSSSNVSANAASSIGLGATSLAINGGYNVSGFTKSPSGAATIAGTITSVGNLSMSGGSVTINAAPSITLTSLTISSGTLSGTAPIIVSGSPFTWSGGTISGSGAFAFPATTNVSAFVVLDGRSFTNSGTITLASGSTFRGAGGMVLNNSGMIDMAGDVSLDKCCSGTATLNNSGTFEKSAGTGNSAVGWTLVNQTGGVARVDSGTLTFSDVSTSTASFAVANGATMNFSGSGGTLDASSALSVAGTGAVKFTGTTFISNGTYSVASTAFTQAYGGSTTINGTITGVGNVDVAGGTLTINSAPSITLPTLSISSGTLTGTAPIVISGTPFNWTGGTISGSGSLTLPATTNISNFVVIDTRTVTSSGTINLANGGTLRGANGTVLNHSGIFNINGDASVDQCCSGTATLNNSGTFRKVSGTGNTPVGWTLLNQSGGQVLIQSGTVTLSAIGASTSTFTVSGGSTLVFSGTGGTLDASSTLTAGATDTVQFGASVTINGTYNVTGFTKASAGATSVNGTITSIGNLNVNGGTISINSASTITLPSLTMSVGTLTGTAPITISGSPFNWSGGTISGTGLLTLPAATNVNGFCVLSQRTVNNTGTITISGTNTLRGDSGVVINNSGTLDINGDGSVDKCCSGTASIFNSGTVEKSAGSGSSPVSWSLVNQTGGQVIAQAASLSLSDIGTSTSSFTANSGCALIFTGTGGTLDASSTLTTSGTGGISIFATLTVNGTFSLASGGLLQNSGGTLTINGTISSFGALTMNGGSTTLNSASAVSMGNTHITGGTLTGTSNVTITGATLNWSGGTISGSGTLTLPAASSISGFVILSGRPVTNGGTITLAASAILRGDSGAVLTNNGTIDIAGDAASFDQCCSGIATLTNNGILKKSAGTGTATAAWSVNNATAGTIKPLLGILSFTGGLTQSGTFLFPISSLTGYGVINVNGPLALGGTLTATTTGGYTPNTGDTFPVLTYASKSGNFAAKNLTYTGGQFNDSYTANTMTLTAASVCTPPPGNVVSWYRAEGNANDDAGPNNGTFVGGATTAAGHVGQAFSLTGGYVTVPDSGTLRPTSITVETWVKWTSLPGTEVILSKNVGGATADSLLIWHDATGLHGLAGTTSSFTYTTYAFTPSIGTWYHVAFTFDSATHTQTLYLNGVVVDSNIHNISIQYDSHPMLIGAEDENGTISYQFAGAIDEVALYSRALNSGEIQSIYNSDTLGKCFTASAPNIASFTPASGIAGTIVTITGTSFNGATAVSFNGTPAASFTVDNGTQITATVASGTTTGTISVTNATGTGTSAGAFTIATPATYNAIANGNWSSGSTWDHGTAPNSFDDAVINGKVVTMDVSATVVNLSLTGGGQIIRPGSITAANTFNWDSGQVEANINVPTGGVLRVSNAFGIHTLQGDAGNANATITNNGTILMQNNSLSFGNGAKIQNNNLLDIQGDFSVFHNGSGNFPIVVNAAGATIQKSAGGGTAQINATTTSDGTVTSSSGNIQFGGAVTASSTAVFNSGAGAGIIFSANGNSFATGISFGGSATGNVAFRGNTAFTGAITTNHYFGLESGMTATFNTATVTGTISWDSATITGPSLSIPNGSNVQVVNAFGVHTLTGDGGNSGGIINNSGTVSLIANSISMGNGAQLNNISGSPGGVIDILGNFNIFWSGSGTQNTVANPATCTLQKSGGGSSSQITGILTNGGTVHAIAGTIQFMSAMTATGTFNSDAGTSIVFSGNGNSFAGGTLFNGNALGAYAFRGNSTFNGAINTPGYFGLESGSTATFNNVTFTGTMSWDSATITGPELAIAEGSALQVVDGFGVHSLSGTTIDNQGTISLVGNSISYGSGAQINNLNNSTTGGKIDFQNNFSITFNGVGGTPGISNSSASTIRKSAGGSTSLINGTLSNSGTVHSLTGSIQFASAITNTASAIYNVNASASVVFAGNGNTFPSGVTYNGVAAGNYAFRGNSTFAGTITTASYFGLESGMTATFNSVIFNGTMSWDSATITGPSLNIASGSTLNIVDGFGVHTLTGDAGNVGGLIANDGTINLIGNNVSMSFGASIQNNNLVDIQGNFSLQWSGNGNLSSITNVSGATFKKSVGGSTANVIATFGNSGTVRSMAGTLQISSAVTHDATAVVTADAGAAVVFSGPNNTVAAGCQFTGAATGAIAFRGSTTFNGNIASVPYFGLESGMTATFNNVSLTSGKITWDSATITGAGLTIANGAEMTVVDGFGVHTLTGDGSNLGGIITNNGTLSLVSNNISLSNAAKIFNTGSPGGLIDFQGNFSTGWSGNGGTPLITNDAGSTIRKSVGGATANLKFGQAFTNNGIVESQAGTLSFDNGFTNGASGTMTSTITSASSYGVFNISGTANLGGTLSAAVGYTPQGGTSYNVVTFSSNAGVFSNGSIPFGTGRSFAITYPAGIVRLTASGPTVNSLSITSGPTTGGTTVTISGSGFVSTPTVTFGGTPATGVTFTSSSTITAVTPAHVAGTVDVVVTNPDGQPGTKTNAFTFVAVTASVTVTSNADSGPNTLRQAILDANSGVCGPACTINFNLPLGSRTITPSTQFPIVTAPVILDGASQPGWAGVPLIDLNGALAGTGGTGFYISGGSSTVRGFVFRNFDGAGVELNTLGGNTVTGNYFGLSADGTTINANHHVNLFVNHVSNNVIGGTTPAQRNVISGSSTSGVGIEGGTNNLVIGNYIGTDATGTLSRGNTFNGVYLSASTNNTIGGTTPAERNVISANGSPNVLIGDASSGNTVSGNYIGTNAAGSAALANGWTGVTVYSASANNTIGGSAAGAGNLVSGNADGILIFDTGSTGNVVQGNIAGLNAAGNAAIPNTFSGIAITNGASGNSIVNNVTSGNSTHGIAILDPGSDFNIVRGNIAGLNPAGSAAIGNALQGIAVFGNAQHNTVGGTTVPDRNVASGNGNNGIVVAGTGTDFNDVKGNTVGLDVSGSSAIPNNLYGISIYGGATNTTVGGAGGARNVISGNAVHGVLLADTGTSNNQILGNFIGTDGNGSGSIPNGGDGVRIDNSATNNVVGNLGNGNTIANNLRGVGVSTSSKGNRIAGNSIFSNTLIGIDLGLDGPTPNDATDADAGANNLQNFPALANAHVSGGNVTVDVSLNSSSALGTGALVIDLFKASGTYVGSSACLAGNVLNAVNVSVPAGTIVAGDNIVSTATSYANGTCTIVNDGTSEFSAPATVTVPCTPPPATISAPSSVCPNAANVNASVANTAGASYVWSVTNGSVVSGQGTPNLVFNAGPSGSVTLNVTVSNGCSNSGSANVLIGAAPSPVISGPSTMCPGGNVTLDAGAGFTSYLWSTGATTQTINVSPAATTTYSVTVTNGTGCSGSASKTVTVSSAITPVITAPPNVCQNTSASASVNAQPGLAIYTWTITGGTIDSGQGTTNITFTAGASGNVVLGVSVVAGGCSGSSSATVPIIQMPSATITAPPTVCANSSATASAPFRPFASYLWTITGGTITSGQGASTITFIAGASGNVVLGVSTPSGCGNASSSATIPIAASPAPTITGPSSVCPGSTVALDAGAGFTSYLWSTGATTQTITVAPSATTTYSVTITNGSGCSNSATHTVNVSSAPTATINAPVNVIAGSAGNNANVNPGPVGTTYSWTIAGGTITSGQGTNAIVFSAGSGSSVTLGVTVTSGGCTDTGSVTIPVGINSDLAISMAASPNSVSGGDLVAFILTITNNGPADATNVVVNDSLSGGATFKSSSGPGWDCSGTTCSTPFIGAGSTTSITINVTAPFESTTIGSSATITSATADPNGNNNSASAAAAVLTIPSSDPCANRSAAALIAPANNSTTTSSQIDFKWNSAANATGYRAWASIDGSPFASLGTTSNTTLHRAITSGHVAWFVETLFDGCASLESEHRAFDVAKAQNCGTAVASLISPDDESTTTNANVTFAWSSVQNATGYEVWLALNNGSPAVIGTTSGATTLTATVPAGAIEWFVRANFDGCDSRDSAKRHFTYEQPAACSDQHPVLIAPFNGITSLSPINFSWKEVAGAASYKVRISADGGAFTTLSTTSVPHLDDAVVPAGAIDWIVDAFFGNNCPSTSSSPNHLTILAKPQGCPTPAAPSIYAPASASSGVTYTIRWSKVGGGSSYALEESARGDFTDAVNVNSDDDNADFTHTNAGNDPLPFYYRVRALSNCGAQPSPNSGIVAIFILPQSTTTNQLNGVLPADQSQPVTYTLNIDKALAGSSFTASVNQPWLTVTPSSGVVPAAGLTLQVVANTNGLPLGTSLGSVTIITNPTSSGSRAATKVTPVNTTVSVSLVQPVQSKTNTSPPPDALIIPAIAHADGINSKFQSDVRVTNTAPQTIKYQITFTPSGDNGAKDAKQTTLDIDAGKTVALDDILATWFNSGTAKGSIGTLEIRRLTELAGASSSASALAALANLTTFASSRTYNAATNGTFGQSVPAVPFANFIGGSGQIQSLQQIAQSSAYRTNLGLVEGSGNPASVLVSVFGGDGKKITEFPVNLTANQHTQLNSFLAERNLTVTDGRVQVKVTSPAGRVTSYASVLDNLTNDPLLVTPVAISETGSSKYVIPGVADLSNGLANWRTDTRVYNATDKTVTANLLFYSQNGGEPKTKQITLAPNEVKQLDNTLASVFGITNDGGALHITTANAASLITSARTYNQTSNGTFGQFVNGITPAEATAAGARALQLLQVEESDRYRSNIGVVEVNGKPAKVELMIVPADGRVAAKLDFDLAPNEFRQFNSLLKSLGTTYNARVTMRVVSGEGRITAYASVIDAITQDPTCIQAQ